MKTLRGWGGLARTSRDPPQEPHYRDGQRRYSDLAIETALTLRLLYHLPLRQTEGFLHALFGMMRLDLVWCNKAAETRCANRRGRVGCWPKVLTVASGHT